MTKWWKRGLALSLGLLASGSRAADPVPAVQLERPVIAATSPRPAAASLSRPVPLTAATATSSSGVVDQSVRPIAYSNVADTPDVVIRGQAPDATAPKPMPAGPVDPTLGAATTPAPQSVWRRYAAASQPSGSPTELAPLAASAGTVVASAGQGVAAAAGPPPGSTTTTVPTEAPAIAGPAWSLLHGNFSDWCNSCPADACDGCGSCCSCTFSDRFYVSGEYLLWWIKGSNTPPLVTRGSAGDPVPGALGLPGTTVLFGGGGVEDNPFSGGRLNVGYWFGDQHLLGVDFGGFFLGQQGKNFSASSTGTPILARPIINAATGMEDTEIVALPGVLAGSVAVNTDSKMFGYEGNLRSNLFAGQFCNVDYFVDGILGFRAVGLDENLNINEALVVVGGSDAGAQFATQDQFGVQNRFYGGQVGFLSEFRWNRWVLDLNAKAALGSTQEMVSINGSTVITPLGGTPHPFVGGLLALPSNIGRYTRDEFTWVPELGLNIGYQCCDHIKLFVGYDILYWSSVVRPGGQIDRVVNTNQLPPPVAGGPARPAFAFNSTDFWAQGVTFGVEFRY
jgi:Putative beta barrel porin-7 (BBP7)